jgi:hypothetical protein
VREHFGQTPPPVILHGFSRGSTNTYAVVAWDRAATVPMLRGVISNAGGFQADYPPNARIVAVGFGTQPFKDLPWLLVCSDQDPRPDYDGCPAMKKTQTWLELQGADPSLMEVKGMHGAFQNAHAAMEKAVGLFF